MGVFSVWGGKLGHEVCNTFLQLFPLLSDSGESSYSYNDGFPELVVGAIGLLQLIS